MERPRDEYLDRFLEQSSAMQDILRRRELQQSNQTYIVDGTNVNLEVLIVEALVVQAQVNAMLSQAIDELAERSREAEIR